MNKIVSFILGVGIGSVPTYFITKRIIEERTDKEIKSVVKTFKKRFYKIENILTDEQKEELGIHSPSKEVLESNPIEENIIQENYKKEMNDLGYSNGVDLSDNYDQHANNIVDLGSAPYVITEEEFGEFGNDEETLILYSDGVLATEDDEPIDDIEELLGDSLKVFGEYDETLYVRNQEKETDYVIIRSEKKWSDIDPEVNE